jgi:hypothetical protein
MLADCQTRLIELTGLSEAQSQERLQLQAALTDLQQHNLRKDLLIQKLT